MPKLTDPEEYQLIKEVYFGENKPKTEEADREEKRNKNSKNQAR
jgi:hypothetical protein